MKHLGDNYRLGLDSIDWNKVYWIEIDYVKYVKERICHFVDNDEYFRYRCDNCSYKTNYSGYFKYCPGCGARVEGTN